MTSKTQTIRQIVILSLTVLLLSLIVFPSRFGTQLITFSFVFVLTELVFYGAVLFWFKRDTSLIKLVFSAGICLAYRFFLGCVFGALISIMYFMNFEISINLGLVSYVPAILCQIVTTPFIIKTVLNDLVYRGEKRSHMVEELVPIDKPKSEQPVFERESSIKKQEETETMATWVNTPKKQNSTISSQKEVSSGKNLNGFDRATQYIGENGSVMMAIVVDDEGLLLSNFVRGNISLDDWAPMALLFKQQNNQVLDRVGMKNIDQITLTIDDMRVALASEEGFNLMVLADIQQDDVLNIRITQGMEIIRKYMAERYVQKLIINAENKYV